ncbi:MAG TPA: hypothetical protein VE546_00755 [Streptomyces sp.]|uniref:hypothetical protein n=1 Tax=Streptomyces sp. TaxID=1931 RepID=UPI002D742677|nr:hypothetical protein [Streptomyces sp.]HZG02098.1 hypothetical protein [Streptomyces sp.]
MEAHEREPEPTAGSESAPAPSGVRADHAAAHRGPSPGCGPVPMSELLASCAAADAVSTPPAHGRREGGDGSGAAAA